EEHCPRQAAPRRGLCRQASELLCIGLTNAMNYAEPPDADILEFIAQDGCTDEQFDQLALRLFAYQYHANAPFRGFCQRRGATVRNVKSWSDIPPVTIDALQAM